MNDDRLNAKNGCISADWPEDISFVFGQADLVVSTVTISSKVHPQAKAFLEQAAREVNDVWNFCNETSHKAWNTYKVYTRKWLSAFDMNNLLAGCGDEFTKIGIDVAQSVAAEHANKRNQTHYAKLKFRKSSGSKKSLGWVPFKANTLRFSVQDGKGKNVCIKGDAKPRIPAWPQKMAGEGKENYALRKKAFEPTRVAAAEELMCWEYRRIQACEKIKVSFMGKTIRLFNAHRLLNAYRLAMQGVGSLRSGNFAQDSVGDWYVNVVVDRVELPLAAVYGMESSIGLDPGQKVAMTGSDGSHYLVNSSGVAEPNVIPQLRSKRYTEMEPQIQQAQRRGHRRKAKRLHRKAARQRKNDRDVFCKEIVSLYQRIWIGNLSPRKMAKSRLNGQAKSIMDAGIGMASTTLKSLGHRAGRVVETIDERYSTRRCSVCMKLSGPSGLESCDVRQWVCGVPIGNIFLGIPGCNTQHLRDVNGGENIRHSGELQWNGWSLQQRRENTVAPRYWRPFAGTR